MQRSGAIVASWDPFQTFCRPRLKRTQGRLEGLVNLLSRECLHLFLYIKVPEEAQIVLSIDTLDFTKGLLQRVAAVERLLETYHMHRGKVVFVQVCLASRTEEGDQLRQMLEEKVEEVNSRLGQPDWQPIQLKFNPLSDLELAAAYRDADVALVTPLRDGMNLTGKEFVACRLDPLKPGVLILSPFTGAADVMQEALLVNPYEVDDDVLY